MAGIGGGVYGIHRLQIRRQITFTLTEADARENAGEFEEAAKHLQDYLKLRPNDGATWRRLAADLERAGASVSNKEQLLAAYDQAERSTDSEEKLNLRRRQAELLYEIGRFSDAVERADVVLRAAPRDAVALRIRAMGMYAQVTPESTTTAVGATEACRKAFDADRTNIDLAHSLAILLRDYGPRLTDDQLRESTESADAVYDQLLEALPGSSKPWLARYRYRTKYRLPNAADDLKKAFQIAPDEPEVLAEMGAAAATNGDFAKAAEHYEAVLTQRSKDFSAYVKLAHFYVKLDDRQKAEEVWTRASNNLAEMHPLLLMQRAETLIQWRRLDDAETAIKELDKLAESLNGKAAPSVVDQLSHRVRLLRGLLLSARGDHRSALALLEKVDLKPITNTLPVTDEQRAALWASRGACHRALGQWDLAAHAFERAATLSEDDATFLSAAADCYLRIGRNDVSTRLMERATRGDDAGPQHRLFRVQSLIKGATRVTTNDAAWAEIGRELDALEKLPDFRAPASELRAEVATKQGRLDDAVRLLEKAQSESVSNRRPLISLIFAYESIGDATAADEQLRRVKEFDASSPDTIIASANLMLRRGNATGARATLTEAVGGADTSAKTRLVAALADLYQQTMRAAEAKASLASLLASHPDNLVTAEKLAAAAWQTRDFDLLEKTEQTLKRLEGEDGIQWRYYGCLRLVAQATDTKDRRFIEAARLRAEIHAMRPGMALSAILAGVMAEREGKNTIAIESYRRAVDLGYQRGDVLEPLVKLLLQQNRGAEAEQYAAMMQSSVSDMQWTWSGANSHSTLNVRIAQLRQAIEDQPNSAAPRLALGQSLVTIGQLDDAQEVFVEATQKFPKDRGTWTALAALYVRLGKGDDYKATMAAVDNVEGFTPADRLMISALAFELGGRLNLADQRFREIATLNPPSIEGLQTAARFFANTDLSLAIECLRQVRQLDPKAHDATRLLAKLLLSMDSETAISEVKQLIKQLPPESSRPIELRLNAFQLLSNGTPDELLKAIDLLNELTIGEEAEPLDRLAFARALEKAGRFESARVEYLHLASSANVSPLYLMGFIEFLLRRNDLEAADQWLRVLEPRLMNDLRPVALRAMWLKAANRVPEIPKLVNAGIARATAEAPNDPAKLRTMLIGASILANCGLQDEVDRIVDEVTKRGADSYLPLAIWLTKEGKLQPALDLCIKSLQNKPTPEAAMHLVSVVSLDPSLAESNSDLEAIVADLSSKYSSNQMFQFSLATLRQVQGRTDEAKKLFDQLLEKNPSHVLALNNVAVMLADQAETRDQALEYVDRAIKLRGMQAMLADTRGWILLQQDKLAESHRHFERAIQDTPTDPRFHFHLALAKQRQGDATGARASLDVAKRLKLLTQGLVPDERRLLAELEQAIGKE